MVTMNAGSSTNQKRSIGAAIVALATVVVLSAQTGQPLGGPKFTAQLNNGDPCNGCKLFAYVGGTTTKQDTYTSSTLGTSNANPVVLDSAGRATVFLDPTLVYKFVLAPSTDTDPPGSPLWTVDNVTGQFSGVVTVTAANTRGIQVTRSGADAGLSLTSSGGSGKTYGIVSNTSGALLIRDDGDGTPQITLSGNDITATLTGNYTISGGLLQQSGAAGDHILTGSVNGANRLGIRNTSSGTAAVASFLLGNDGASNAGALFALGSSYTTSGSYVADGVAVEATRAGGLSLTASNASGVIRAYTGGLASGNERFRITSAGRVGIGTSSPSNDADVRSTADGVSSGGLRVSRSDGSYLILNTDDGAPGGGFGNIQAGDGSGFLPTKISPSGGGASIGGGTAIASIITATASWDIPSKINDSMESTTVTVTGVQTTSPCFVGFYPNTAGTALQGVLLSANYDSANTVRVVALNKTGSTIDPTSATVRVTCFTY